MTIEQFSAIITKQIKVAVSLCNPGKGESQIRRITPNSISYIRGKSTISIKMSDLFLAYKEFRGGKVSSRDLKDFKPEVFDSSARPAGHSCNCTFFFMVLQEIGLVDSIEGKGLRGNPFYAFIK